jgi:hypothetical protein
MRRITFACVFALIAAAADQSYAQGFGTSGTSAFGGNSFGSGFGNSGFGSSGFGNSGFGGSGNSGFGGFGNSGVGNSGFGGMGNSGFGGFGNSGFGNSGFGGMGNSGFGGAGNSGFGGGGNTGYGGNMGGQNFGGGTSDTWSQFGQASTQFFNNMNRNMGRQNRQRNDSSSANVENPPQEMRVRLEVAFNAPRPTTEQLASSLGTKLSTILARQGIVAPEVTLEGNVAVLRGVAATDGQRLVLEKLIAMEPGIRAVRNEMTVADATATESAQ